MVLLLSTNAFAINEKYRQKLEKSGCTQISESQGCDVNKTKKQNAKAGYVSEMSSENTAAASKTPYAGQWVAKSTSGATVATIRIDAKENVWVNAKKVKAKRSDGALVFHDGKITFTIQGDRRLINEDIWLDSDAGTKGQIFVE